MADIVAVGEMLVDFTQKVSETGEITYTQNAGGSSANVAVMAAKPQASSEKSERICSDAT